VSVLCLGEAIVDLFCERPVAGDVVTGVLVAALATEGWGAIDSLPAAIPIP